MTKERNLLSFLLVVVLLLLLPSPSSGAGMSTHSVCGERSLFWFASNRFPEYAQILETRKPWWQPGTFFPDWGYSCGFPRESEIAHWPKFLNESVHYFSETYPRPWTEDAQNLIAFLFGILAHSVSDDSWHSLGMSEGLISAMGDTEFAGSFDQAHGIADTGGEFVLKFVFGLEGNAELKWNIPSDDLAKIYQRGYGEGNVVGPENMERCLLLGYAGIWANQILGDLALPYARESTLLNEEYDNYFLGGLNDVSAWTAHCWEDLARWLDSGKGIRPMCTMLENQWRSDWKRDASMTHDDLFASEESLKILENLGYRFRSIKQKKNMAFEIYREDGQNPKEFHAAQVQKMKKLLEEEEEEARVATCIKEDQFRNNSTLSFSIGTKYSELGYSLLSGDFNGDGISDLVLGAPIYGLAGSSQIGAVYVVYGKRNLKPSSYSLVDIEAIADWKSYGQNSYDRFGFSLALVDINKDNFDDLVISSPTHNGLEMFYDGQVLAYLGSASGLSNEPFLTINTIQPFPVLDPNNSHQFKYVLMGQQLNSADIDGDGFLDLIVGSPLAAPHAVGRQRGLVSIFLASSNHRGNLNLYDNADIEISGTKDYQRFGSYSQVVQTSAGKRLLLVGSNFYGIDSNLQTVGRIYGYDLSDFSNPLFIITGDSAKQKFGTTFTAGDFYGDGRLLLAVSSPSEKLLRAWQAGSVRVLDISGLQGEVSLGDLKLVTTIKGGEKNGHFGWSFAKSSNSLWISEPMYGNFRGDEKAATGRIFEYKFGSTFPSGNLNNDRVTSASTCLAGKEVRGRFGFSIISLDLNGDGIEDLATSTIGSNAGARAGGVVSVFFG